MPVGTGFNDRRSKGRAEGSLKSPDTSDQRYSIVVVGCGAVGKTSITLRFLYDEFDEVYDPTRADSYRKRVIDDKGEVCDVDILDTAGQEEYAAIRDNYYRNGEGFICVYSVSDRTSFRAIPEFRNHICRALNNPSPLILLLANKIDVPEAQRKISQEEGEEMAAKWPNCRYGESSAKLGSGVEAAFLGMTRMIQAKRESDRVAKCRSNSKHNKQRIRLCTIQ